MEAREEENSGNALLHERPLIAAAHQIFSVEIVAELQQQLCVRVLPGNDRLQIWTECGAKYVQGVDVIGGVFFWNLLSTIAGMLFVAADHVHLKHGYRAVQ